MLYRKATSALGSSERQILRLRWMQSGQCARCFHASTRQCAGESSNGNPSAAGMARVLPEGRCPIANNIPIQLPNDAPAARNDPHSSRTKSPCSRKVHHAAATQRTHPVVQQAHRDPPYPRQAEASWAHRRVWAASEWAKTSP